MMRSESLMESGSAKDSADTHFLSITKTVSFGTPSIRIIEHPLRGARRK